MKLRHVPVAERAPEHGLVEVLDGEDHGDGGSLESPAMITFWVLGCQQMEKGLI